MSQEPQQPRQPTALLIPKARGGRAQRATYLLLALCAAALYLAGEPLMPAARSLTFHFVALEIRALLKGICYLAEEIFHLQSRHHGSFWRALSACFSLRWHGPLLLVCGSAYVALRDGDGQPLGLHLGLVSFCELLVLALGLQKPSAVEISEMSEKSKQNVAHGLAWSYYVGYLKIVLPRVKKSMEEFSRANPNALVCRETWKLHILVPLSCDIYDDLEKADSNIRYLTDLTETTLTRAGTKKRVYKHSLYAIQDEDKLCVCLASIYPLLPSPTLHWDARTSPSLAEKPPWWWDQSWVRGISTEDQPPWGKSLPRLQLGSAAIARGPAGGRQLHEPAQRAGHSRTCFPAGTVAQRRTGGHWGQDQRPCPGGPAHSTSAGQATELHRGPSGSAQHHGPPAALCQTLGPPAPISFSSLTAALALRGGVRHPAAVPLRHVPGRGRCLQPGGTPGAGQAFLQDVGGDPERLQGVRGHLPAHCVRGVGRSRDPLLVQRDPLAPPAAASRGIHPARGEPAAQSIHDPQLNGAQHPDK
ncbi:stimulator of interferon genes protein isoform X1 [Larus michahellis]|uniref:stimulator of interferon genes protein isoform X1 n=1 Tax=Larus michahellis TaxID=119627 RepID=UPI003D9BCB5C